MSVSSPFDEIADTELITVTPNLALADISILTCQDLPYSDPPSNLSSDASLTQQEETLHEKLSNQDASNSPDEGEERICLICGDKANGVHYNVLSCEGCKSFFLRNMRQKTKFVCAEEGRCNMDLYTRRHCPACRMKRCLESGMSIERVWDNKRLKTRKQMTRTKKKKKRPGDAVCASESPEGSLLPSFTLTPDQTELLDRLEKGYYASTDLFRNITRGIPEKFVNFWTQATSVGAISTSTTITQSQAKNDDHTDGSSSTTITQSQAKNDNHTGSSSTRITQSQAKNDIHTGSSSTTITQSRAKSDNHTSLTTESTTSHADLHQQACEAHSQGKGLPSIYKVSEYLTNGCSGSSVGSSSNPLPEQSETVQKEMLHLAMDMFATVVKQTIHFAKNIPRFTDLTCDDQAVLIKASIVDALLLRCTESFELEKGYLENPFNGDKFDIDMMYYLGFSALPKPAFEFMRRTKACGLNKAEFALLTAVALIAPDRSDLKNRDLVERIQSFLISTLYAATKHFHPDKPLLFAHLMSKLTTLRDMSVLHLSELMEYKFCGTDLSPLVIELFGLDS